MDVVAISPALCTLLDFSRVAHVLGVMHLSLLACRNLWKIYSGGASQPHTPPCHCYKNIVLVDRDMRLSRLTLNNLEEYAHAA